jgi:hypothetical protein
MSPPPAATAGARRAARAPARRASSRVAPRIPRRVSGPARGRAAARAAAQPFGVRVVAFASTLPDRGIVDRMVRGRAWIAVVGTLLIGLVAMQVSLLKLNSGIGGDVERAAALERTNGELRAQVSQLESGERIQENAAGLGMIMPPAGQITYLRGGASAATAAAQAMHDQRFNDSAKAQSLPGEGAALANAAPTDGTSTTGTTTTATGDTSTGTSTTDTTSTSTTPTDGTSTTSTDATSTTASTPSTSTGGTSTGTGAGP